MHANEVRQIEAAISWAKRHNLEIVIVGGSGFKQLSNYLISNYPNITLVENTDYKKGNLYG